MTKSIPIPPRKSKDANLIAPAAMSAFFLLSVLKSKPLQDSILEELIKNGDATEDFKNTLKDAGGLGNVGTLSMILYALIVIPQEKKLEECEEAIADMNKMFAEKALSETNSDYAKDGTDNSTINYFQHIRNAVSHAHIELNSDNKTVIFKDQGKDKKCDIYFKLDDLEDLCFKLLTITNQYVISLGDKA